MLQLESLYWTFCFASFIIVCCAVFALEYSEDAWSGTLQSCYKTSRRLLGTSSSSSEVFLTTIWRFWLTLWCMKQLLQSWIKHVIFSVFMELPSVDSVNILYLNFTKKQEAFVLYYMFGRNAQILLWSTDTNKPFGILEWLIWTQLYMHYFCRLSKF